MWKLKVSSGPNDKLVPNGPWGLNIGKNDAIAHRDQNVEYYLMINCWEVKVSTNPCPLHGADRYLGCQDLSAHTCLVAPRA